MTRSFWQNWVVAVFQWSVATAVFVVFIPRGTDDITTAQGVVMVLFVLAQALVLSRIIGGLIGYLLIRGEAKRKVQARGRA